MPEALNIPPIPNLEMDAKSFVEMVAAGSRAVGVPKSYDVAQEVHRYWYGKAHSLNLNAAKKAMQRAETADRK